MLQVLRLCASIAQEAGAAALLSALSSAPRFRPALSETLLPLQSLAVEKKLFFCANFWR